MSFKIFEKKIYFNANKINKIIPKKKNLYFTKNYLKRNKKKNDILISNKDFDLDYCFIHFMIGLSSIKKNIRLLDFGSGVGNTLIKFLKKGNISKNIHYSLYDQNKELTKIAKNMIKKKFIKFSKINFYNDFKKIKYHDAIHFGSMLEYVDDYEQLINNIFSQMKKKPNFIFVSDFFGTTQKNFYLIGNYYGNKYSVKFHNIKKFINYLKKKGYKLIYKNPHLPNIKGNFGFFDMSNIKKEYRITHTWNLFFQHEKK